MHRPRTAVGDQHEIPWVKTPLHRNQPDGAYHVGVGDLDDAPRRLDRLEIELSGKMSNRVHGQIGIQFVLSSQEVFRVDASQEKIRVRDGGFGLTLAVTGRTRIGSSALRSDPQSSARIYPGN